MGVTDAEFDSLMLSYAVDFHSVGGRCVSYAKNLAVL